MSDDFVQEEIARQHLGIPDDDDFDTVEFLASSCRDIETGRTLKATARPDLYVHDVLVVASEYAAMRDRIAELEAALRFYAEQCNYDYPETENGGDPLTAIELDEGAIARDALGEKKE